MAPKRVLVIGSGPGGLAFVREALRVLPKDGVEITVVEASRRVVFKPILTYVATGFRDPEDVYVSVEELEKLGVKAIFDEAVKVDAGERKVLLRGGSEISYDYLVVAAGGEPNEAAIPGLAEANINPWTVEGAVKLREALKGLGDGSRVVVGALRPPYPCPPAPFELAGLVVRVGERLGRKFNVTAVFFEKPPLRALGEEVYTRVLKLLESSGIEFIGGIEATEVDPQGKVLRYKGGEASFDLLAVVPPFKPPRLLRDSGLAPESGWPAVDPYKGFRHAKYDDIFLIGDSSIAVFRAPMSGFLASHMAQAATAAIARDLGVEVEPPKRAYATCFVDHIVDGAAIFCDFTGVIYGEGKPHCHVVAEGPLTGAYKKAYEDYWKGNVAP